MEGVGSKGRTLNVCFLLDNEDHVTDLISFTDLLLWLTTKGEPETWVPSVYQAPYKGSVMLCQPIQLSKVLCPFYCWENRFKEANTLCKFTQKVGVGALGFKPGCLPSPMFLPLYHSRCTVSHSSLLCPQDLGRTGRP